MKDGYLSNQSYWTSDIQQLNWPFLINIYTKEQSYLSLIIASPKLNFFGYIKKKRQKLKVLKVKWPGSRSILTAQSSSIVFPRSPSWLGFVERSTHLLPSLSVWHIPVVQPSLFKPASTIKHKQGFLLVTFTFQSQHYYIVVPCTKKLTTCTKWKMTNNIISL